MRPDEGIRVDMTDCENSDHIHDLQAAEAMAAAIDLMTHLGQIDPRSAAADARLGYGDGEPWTEDEARQILSKYR